MRVLRITPVLLLLLWVVACQSKGHQLEDHECPQDVLWEQVARWNAGDIEGFMEAGYWNSQELVFQSSSGRREGYDAVLARYQDHYGSDDHEMGVLSFSDLEVFEFSDTDALVRGRWALDYENHPDEDGLFTLWMRRFDEGWRIVHDQTGMTTPATHEH